MKKSIEITLYVVLALAFVVFMLQSRHSSDWKKISPFTEVQFEDGGIVVKYDGEFYELSSIEGISSRRLKTVSMVHFGFIWEKRIREDLAEVLEAAGADETTTVRLELKNLDTGEIVTVAEAEMTQENRSVICRNL